MAANTSNICTASRREPAICPETLGIGPLFWRMREAVVVGDVTTGRIVLWNPAAERLFGWSADEIIGAPIERIIPDRHRGAHGAGMRRYAATGLSALVDSDVPFEVAALRRNGSELIVEVGVTPLDDARYLVAFVRDATERTRLAEERAGVAAEARENARRLEELNALKAGFTAMVAHELGAPVASIRALVDLLSREDLPAEEAARLLTLIRVETGLLTRLVFDIQRSAEVERDDFSVHPSSTPVATILGDASWFARLFPGDHPLRHTIDPEVLRARVMADPERIGQVLRNLLSNAARHTPPGTSIALGARIERDRVRIEVTDSGPGIHPEDRQRIIEKFGRGRDTDAQRKPGAGLGLYVARRILSAHGTDLEIASVPGKGASFGFTLERA